MLRLSLGSPRSRWGGRGVRDPRKPCGRGLRRARCPPGQQPELREPVQDTPSITLTSSLFQLGGRGQGVVILLPRQSRVEDCARWGQAECRQPAPHGAGPLQRSSRAMGKCPGHLRSYGENQPQHAKHRVRACAAPDPWLIPWHGPTTPEPLTEPPASLALPSQPTPPDP